MRSVILGGFVAAIALASACSLTTSFDGISDGVRTDAGGGDAGPAIPPARPAGATTPTGARSLWLGVKHFHFAHSNDALKKPGAWEDWGWDIDGLCTGAVPTEQVGSCQRSSKVTPDQVRDGNRCRDNNFGSQIVPQLSIYNNQFENETNAALLEGKPTWLFVLEDLGDGADDPYVPAKLYLVAGMPDKTRPAWDGTDIRQVLPRSVTGTDPKAAVVTFPKGYLKDNVWVSGEPAKFDFALPIGATGELQPMQIQAGIIAFQLNPAHSNVVDGTGQVAGAMPVSGLEGFLKPFLLTQTTFCPGIPAYTNLIETAKTYADVYLEAPKLQDSSKPCDGVSIGFGINLSPVAEPNALGTEKPAATGGCGDAGTDASSETGTDASTDAGASDAASD